MFTVFTPFFTLGPGSTTLYSSHALSHGLISSTTFLQHSTTLYSLQLYSISTVYNLYNTPLLQRHGRAREVLLKVEEVGGVHERRGVIFLLLILHSFCAWRLVP